jgi:2-iminobutanoate/2-iminopropanoate deaminase
MGDTVGGRQLFYKQGPGDPPSTIETKAGIVSKRTAPEAASAVVAPAPAREAAPVAVAPAPERVAPKPTLAQASPVAPSSAPRSDLASTDLFNRYTQATRYGDLLFVSGQIAVDLRTGAFNGDQDIEAQTRQILENIRAILESNRLTMANVVSTTVFLANISQFTAMDSAYHGFFKGTPPSRTVVEVSHLPRGALVEISLIAGR